jgi:hypothetical protein
MGPRCCAATAEIAAYSAHERFEIQPLLKRLRVCRKFVRDEDCAQGLSQSYAGLRLGNPGVNERLNILVLNG